MVFSNFVTLIAGLCISAGIKSAVNKEVSSDGCRKAFPSGRQTGREYLIPYTDDQGHDRDYLLFIPPQYSKKNPNPVIFSYHGGNKTPEEQRDLDLFETPEFNTDHIVVYLRGYQKRWEGVPNITKRNDILYTQTVLNDLESTYCIDKSRIFMTGKSEGGGFANFAACHKGLSTRFAAFAPVSGSFYIENVENCDPNTVEIPCTPGRPSTSIPIIEFHGGIDTIISYNGSSDRRGACLPNIFHWATSWALRDNLSGQAAETSITTRAKRYQWGSGNQLGLVSHIFEQDVNHSWPYTGKNSDNKAHKDGPASYNASQYIVDFFRKHRLPV
ncbi:ferulic acid esterase [Colletotrichum truncatum]|uniref:Ferulic acid esterase n=1 Tax=Colletotrichum truncatum TaxID=5467 RepID=A0ACC3YJQ8_COLTU|nr:ferulic acid esterase [Colletotrichum truncatum]KAF6797379.1 ferulic acid esterase [Colletotrichum truncatum]